MRGTALGFCCVIALLSVVVWTPKAQGWQYYDDGAGNGCVQCHTLFNGPSSLLHALHQSNFGISECNVCHPFGPGSTPVETYVSGPGGDLGCAGCHGRDYGEISPNSGQPKATGYGLRQHHVNNSVPGCPGCHTAGALGHPNPLPPIVGENVAPPYYGLSTNNLTDPCSSVQEDSSFDVDTDGLDNDGDGSPDFPNDPDCPTPTTTTTTTSGPTTTTTQPVGIPTTSPLGRLLLGGLLALAMSMALRRRRSV
jgi:hypothetical protein